jgi:hypothetical protein
MMNKLKKEYFASLLSVIVVGAVLVVALYTFYDSSLAWFSNNKEVMAQGMSVVSRGAPKLATELNNFNRNGVAVTDASNPFTELIPGDIITFDIVVTNQSKEPVNLRLLMAAPNSTTDRGYVADGNYYYFGTQFRINSIMLGEEDQLEVSGKESYLLTLDDSHTYNTKDGEPVPPTAISSALTFTNQADKVLTDTISIAAGGTLTLKVEIEFVDNGTEQNAYINFGSTAAEDEERKAPFSRQFICFAEFATQ